MKKKSRKTRVGTGKKRRSTGRVGKKPRVVKGRVQLRVSGYTGVQRLPPSSLIPYLPIAKIKAAAKKALLATGKKKSYKKKRTTRKRSRK